MRRIVSVSYIGRAEAPSPEVKDPQQGFISTAASSFRSGLQVGAADGTSFSTAA